MMKKIFAIAVVATSLIACNDSETKTTDATTVNTDTVVTAPAPPVVTYTTTEGDLTVKEGKLMVYRNGAWVVADKDVTLEDGTIVTVKGEARSKDGRKIIVTDGGFIDRTGRWFDKAGNAIENAWEATKEGVKDAGKAIKEGAENVGNKIKDNN